MDMNTDKEREAVARALRKRIVAALREIRMQEWPQERIDQHFPYPFYHVDKKKRTVTVADAFTIRVMKSGRITVRIHKTESGKYVPRHTSIERLAREYGYAVGAEFHETIQNMLSYRRAHKVPKEWGHIQEMVQELVDLAPARGPHDPVAFSDTVLAWLRRRCPFSPARLAGLHNLEAVSRKIRIEVSMMIEALPVPAEVKRNFMWYRAPRVLDPSEWNRMMEFAPLYAALKADNRSLATPFVIANIWSWVTRPHTPRPHWLDVDPKEAISKWRDALIKLGMEPATWRWMIKLPPPQLMSVLTIKEEDPVTGLDVMDPVHINGLNYIVKHQIPAEHTIGWIKKQGLSFIKDLNDPEDVRTIYAEAVIRHLAVELKNRRRLKAAKAREEFDRALRNSITDVHDYLFGRRAEAPPAEVLAELNLDWPHPPFADEGTTLKIPRGVRFGWFEKRSHAWHAKMKPVWEARKQITDLLNDIRYRNQTEAFQRYQEALRKLQWDSALGEIEIDGHQVIPLTNGMMLAEEGAEMSHCVGGYSQSCAEGDCRIFSIRYEGKREATLQIGPRTMRADSAWMVFQVRKYANDPVSHRVARVADLVAAAYAKALKDAA